MGKDIVAGHRLPAAEAEVLRVLLTASGPLLIAELVDLLPGRPRAHTTVSTLLTRLVERGLVVRDEHGRSHRYSAAGSQEQLALAALGQVVGTLDDPAGTLVAFINQLPPTTRRRLTRRLKQPPESS